MWSSLLCMVAVVLVLPLQVDTVWAGGKYGHDKTGSAKALSKEAAKHKSVEADKMRQRREKYIKGYLSGQLDKVREEEERRRRLKRVIEMKRAAEKKGAVLSERQKALEAEIQRKLEERAKLYRKKRAQEEDDDE